LLAILVAEAILWVFVFAIAAYAAYTYISSSRPAATPLEYMHWYAFLAVALSLLLTAVLVAPFRKGLDRARPRLATVALPAFLVAVILHIAAWGVSASIWLVTLQPRFGNALWTFTTACTPIALALSLIYGLKLSAARKATYTQPERDRLPTKANAVSRFLRGRLWYWFLSVLFLFLFSVIAIGSYLTASGIGGDWFPGESSTWTYWIVVACTAILVGALVACSRAGALRSSRTNQTEPGRIVDAALVDDPDLPLENGTRHPAAAQWKVVSGPLIVAATLFVISAAALLVPSELVRGSFRVNTGLVLFIAYASAFLPSYVVVCVLRLLALGD
jgi:hypothetical protein